MFDPSPLGARAWAVVLLAPVLLACGREPAATLGSGAPAAPPPPVPRAPAPEAPWIAVFPGEVAAGECIYYQVHGEPPRLLERRRLLVPLEPEEVPHGIVIVGAVVARTGLVARAQVLKDLPLPPHLGWDEPLAEALRGYRFEPATHLGRPVAVHFNLTLQPESAYADPRPQRLRVLEDERPLPH